MSQNSLALSTHLVHESTDSYSVLGYHNDLVHHGRLPSRGENDPGTRNATSPVTLFYQSSREWVWLAAVAVKKEGWVSDAVLLGLKLGHSQS